MNCIILLLLLSCCGCGRGGCCEDVRPYRDGKHDRGNGCRREEGRREDCRREDCRREERREKEECGCREPRREGGDCGGPRHEKERCDSPGMIPPPWQEYPGFPHRDDRCGCESGD